MQFSSCPFSSDVGPLRGFIFPLAHALTFDDPSSRQPLKVGLLLIFLRLFMSYYHETNGARRVEQQRQRAASYRASERRNEVCSNN